MRYYVIFIEPSGSKNPSLPSATILATEQSPEVFLADYRLDLDLKVVAILPVQAHDQVVLLPDGPEGLRPTHVGALQSFQVAYAGYHKDREAGRLAKRRPTAFYTEPLDQEDEFDPHLMAVADFLAACEDGSLTNEDGTGRPVKNNLIDGHFPILPSNPDGIPADATHIAWYNK